MVFVYVRMYVCVCVDEKVRRIKHFSTLHDLTLHKRATCMDSSSYANIDTLRVNLFHQQE